MAMTEQEKRARATLESTFSQPGQDAAARNSFNAIGRGAKVPGVTYAPLPSERLARKNTAAASLAAPPVAAPPAVQNTAGYAIGNVAAAASDYAVAPARGIIDAGNRGIVGTANVIRNAIGKKDLTPQPMNYTGFQDNLTAVRAANMAPAAPVAKAPIQTAAASLAAPVAAAAPVQAQNTAQPATALPAAPIRTGSALQPSGAYAAGIGKFGENVYDNSSIDKLNANLGVNVASQTNASGAPNILPQAPTAAGQLGAVVNTPGQFDSRRFQGQLDKMIKDLGGSKANMRSKRDLIGQLLGLKGNQVSGNQNIEANAGVKQAEINASANSDLLASNTNQDISKRTAAVQLAGQLPQPTTQLGADGQLYQLAGTNVTPITGADGKAFKPAVASKERAPDPTSEYFKLILENNPGIDAESAMAQAQKLSGIGTQGERTVVRTGTKDGKKVVQYSDGKVELAQ